MFKFHFDYDQLYYSTNGGKLLKLPNAVPSHQSVVQLVDSQRLDDEVVSGELGTVLL